MVGMKSIAWKAGAAATLAAAIVGLSTGQASAAEWTTLHGNVYTGATMGEANSKAEGDYRYLEAQCRWRGGFSWTKDMSGGYDGKKTYTAQAHLNCYHQ